MDLAEVGNEPRATGWQSSALPSELSIFFELSILKVLYFLYSAHSKNEWMGGWDSDLVKDTVYFRSKIEGKIFFTKTAKFVKWPHLQMTCKFSTKVKHPSVDHSDLSKFQKTQWLDVEFWDEFLEPNFKRISFPSSSFPIFFFSPVSVNNDTDWKK